MVYLAIPEYKCFIYLSLYNSLFIVVTVKFIYALLVELLIKFIPKTMKSHKLLVSFVALALLAIVMTASASAAFASINRVTVNGIENFSDQTAAVFAGETVPVRVVIDASHDAKDVRVIARLIGASSLSEASSRFNVIAGGQYSALVNIKMPSNIDPSEGLVLEITVEGKRVLSTDENGNDKTQTDSSETRSIKLEVQRESYFVDILSADSQDQVQAGKILALDVVLKNRGFEYARDTYLRASIPELGVSNTVYFGDLSPQDNADANRDDAVQRRVYLTIPSNAAAGLYTIQLEAYNTDSSTKQTKRIVVSSAGDENRVISPVTSKTFAVGEDAMYSVTIVNSGNTIKVYDIIVDAPKGITVAADQSMIVVPAGSSKTVDLTANAADKGNYNFVVNVHSEGQLVSQETLAAVVQGSSMKVSPSVVLTVVLAVIFIVLVVVLIVLLTRKPQKAEEFGESYY
jgi:hypothetical protein